MNDDVILLTEKDYLRLSHLIKDLEMDEIENLEIELERAKIVPDADMPKDVVTMNSLVEYSDLSTNKVNTVRLVYPSRVNQEGQTVSILSSLGGALIGLREGQELNWQFPNGETRRLKVMKVHYQPEANGDWHL